MSLLTKEKFLKSSSVYYIIGERPASTSKSEAEKKRAALEGVLSETGDVREQVDGPTSDQDAASRLNETLSLDSEADMSSEMDSRLDPLPKVEGDNPTLMSPEEMLSELTVEGAPPTNEKVNEFAAFQEQTEARFAAMEEKYAAKIADLESQLAKANIPNAESLTPKAVEQMQVDVGKEAATNLKSASEKKGFMSAMQGMFSGMGKLMGNVHNGLRNAPLAMKVVIAIAAVLAGSVAVAGYPLVVGGATVTTLWPGGVAAFAPALAGHALAIKGAALLTSGYLGAAAFSRGDKKAPKESPTPTVEQSSPNIPTPQPLAETQAVTSNEAKNSNEKMEQAKFITDVLKANPGAKITLKEGPAIQHLNLSFNQNANNYLSTATDGASKALSQSEFTSALSNLQPDMLDDLEDQAIAIGKNKTEAPKSNIESEKELKQVILSELKAGDKINVTDETGKVRELTVTDPAKGEVSTNNSVGEQMITTITSLGENFSSQVGVVKQDEDLRVNGIAELKNVTKIEVVKAGEAKANENKSTETFSAADQSFEFVKGNLREIPSTINSGNLQKDLNKPEISREDEAKSLLKEMQASMKGGNVIDYIKSTFKLPAEFNDDQVEKVVITAMTLQNIPGRAYPHVEEARSSLEEAKTDKFPAAKSLDKLLEIKPTLTGPVQDMVSNIELATLQVSLQSEKGNWNYDEGIKNPKATNLAEIVGNSTNNPANHAMLETLKAQFKNPPAPELLNMSKQELDNVLINGRTDQKGIAQSMMNVLNGYLTGTAINSQPVIEPPKTEVLQETKESLENKIKNLKPGEKIKFTYKGENKAVMEALVAGQMDQFGDRKGINVNIQTPGIDSPLRTIFPEDIAKLEVEKSESAPITENPK